MKNYKGKAIYNPSGKAGEYSAWACNFYVGCSNGCTYCYLKKGRGAAILGGDTPMLKKCFKSEENALEIFDIEVSMNKTELRKHGLFYSFTTDPMLRNTSNLTIKSMDIALDYDIPVKVLTKRADWLDEISMQCNRKYNIAFGFTLTGHDELEPNASTNTERIEAMRKLHAAGFKTFASIEPIIDIKSSIEMIEQTRGFCDLYKVGLESGKKYNYLDLRELTVRCSSVPGRFYFKESFLKQARMDEGDLPINGVDRDYNMFDNN